MFHLTRKDIRSYEAFSNGLDNDNNNRCEYYNIIFLSEKKKKRFIKYKIESKAVHNLYIYI